MTQKPEDRLRALYRSLQPPPLAEEAEAADPTTAGVVAWMRGAWSEVAVPPAAAPRSIRPLPARWRGVRRILWAAAAALLVLTGSALWRSDDAHPGAASPRLVQEPRSADTSHSDAAVEVLAVRPDQIELRSGPVRLVLLAPTPSESFQPPPGS